MHGVGEPVTSEPESVFLSPLVQLLNVLPAVVVETDLSLTESEFPPKPGMFTVPPDVAVTVWFVSVGDADGLTPQVVLPFQRSYVTVMSATPSPARRCSVTLPSVKVVVAVSPAAPVAVTS